MSLESESGWAGGRKMKGQRSEFTSIHCWLLNEIVFVSSKLERADGVFSRRDTRLEGSPITLMPNGKGMARLCLGWPNIVQFSHGTNNPHRTRTDSGDGVALFLIPTAATTGAMLHLVQDLVPLVPGVMVSSPLSTFFFGAY